MDKKGLAGRLGSYKFPLIRRRRWHLRQGGLNLSNASLTFSNLPLAWSQGNERDCCKCLGVQPFVATATNSFGFSLKNNPPISSPSFQPILTSTVVQATATARTGVRASAAKLQAGPVTEDERQYVFRVYRPTVGFVSRIQVPLKDFVRFSFEEVQGSPRLLLRGT